MSGQTKRRRDVSRLILHRVGCRVGEASNPGQVLLGGIPVLHQMMNQCLHYFLVDSTSITDVTTWADSDGPQVDEPGRRLRVSPSILDALEVDLEVARRDDGTTR